MNITEANDTQDLLAYVLDQGGDEGAARSAAARLAARSGKALGAGFVDEDLVETSWPGRIVHDTEVTEPHS